MNRLTDPVVLLLLVLLLATLVAFLTGVFPYPFGLLVLVALLAGRLMQLHGTGRHR